MLSVQNSGYISHFIWIVSIQFILIVSSNFDADHHSVCVEWIKLVYADCNKSFYNECINKFIFIALNYFMLSECIKSFHIKYIKSIYINCIILGYIDRIKSVYVKYIWSQLIVDVSNQFILNIWNQLIVDVSNPFILNAQTNLAFWHFTYNMVLRLTWF